MADVTTPVPSVDPSKNVFGQTVQAPIVEKVADTPPDTNTRSGAGVVTPPAIEAPKKRGRKPRVVSQAEALATAPPGGKCVDADCPDHGYLRAPKKCVETGKDIWPKMSEKEALNLAGQTLTLLTSLVNRVGGVKTSPPTEEDKRSMAEPTALIVQKRLGSLARFNVEIAFVFALLAFVDSKMAEAKLLQLAAEKKAKTTL